MQGPAPGGGRGLGRGGGRGRKGGFGFRPSGVCVCTNPNYGNTARAHQRRTPCYQIKYPKCGNPLVRGH